MLSWAPIAYKVAMSSIDWSSLLDDANVQTLIDLALREDIGTGDATTHSVFPSSMQAQADVVARSATVACGMPLIAEIVRRFDPDAIVEDLRPDGTRVHAGSALASIRGDVRAILTCERVILNFLMRLCGIATLSRRAVDALPSGCRARIFDTRKTMPGWRRLDKAAVATGGAHNHRHGLFDGVIIKDNHIAAAGSIAQAVEAARRNVAKGMVIQVEVDTLEQLEEALSANPDLILLDNFSLEMMRTAVARTAGRIPLEASGGLTVERVAEVALTGVDRISMGALTHSATPVDIALDFRGAAE